jgi:hypothetical protein
MRILWLSQLSCFFTTVLLLSGGLTGTAEAQLPADPAALLSPELQSALESIPNEWIRPPEAYYYRSNERRHDLLAPHLHGRGGVLIGVGSDQCYTMAFQARSRLLILVDYDRRIPRVHALYHAILPLAESPEEFLALFDWENRRSTHASLQRAYGNGGNLLGMLRHYRRSREEWQAYLQRVKDIPGSWLNSQEGFDYIRDLHASNRIMARTADLTGDQTIRRIGAVLRDAGVEVGILYTSNAEQFFEYSEDFIANMDALPTNDRSVLVRTVTRRGLRNAPDGTWHYVVHDFSDFTDRIHHRYPRAATILFDMIEAGASPTGVTQITADTPRFIARERNN